MHSRQRRILWISSLVLDKSMHKTTQIEILHALARRGHEVMLVGSYSSKKTLRKPEDVHIVQIPLRFMPPLSTIAYSLLVFLYLPFLCLGWRPDFVMVEPGPPVFGILSILAFPKAKKPKIILDNRSGPVRRQLLGNFLFHISVLLACRLSQGVTVITQTLKKAFCKRYNVRPEHVGTWTSGVSIETFDPSRYSKSEIRARFGLTDRFVIFCHGVFGSEGAPRGIPETLGAIALLKEQFPDLTLFLLGEGSLPLDKMTEELGIQHMVTIHGPVDYEEVPRFVAMCDVGIVPLPNLPQWRHQSPLNLLEYLAMEKPVIVSDIPANRDIVGTCKCGLYIESVEPKKIADAIATYHDFRKQLGELGVYGRTLVKERYSWQKVAEDLATYLLDLEPRSLKNTN